MIVSSDVVAGWRAVSGLSRRSRLRGRRTTPGSWVIFVLSLADSNLEEEEEFGETELERVVYHYDNLIEELRRNHAQEVELLRINDKKVRGRLQEKEH